MDHLIFSLLLKVGHMKHAETVQMILHFVKYQVKKGAQIIINRDFFQELLTRGTCLGKISYSFEVSGAPWVPYYRD